VHSHLVRALAQVGPVGSQLDFALDLLATLPFFGGPVRAFLVTLAIGALAVAMVPGHTRRSVDHLRSRPADALFLGLLLVGVVVFVLLSLVVTIVGILLAIPTALVALVALTVTEAVAFLAAGQVVADALWPIPPDAERPARTEWRRPLLFGAVLAAGVAFIPVGGLVSFFLAVAGLGAVATVLGRDAQNL
jgi:hypothetical protein